MKRYLILLFVFAFFSGNAQNRLWERIYPTNYTNRFWEIRQDGQAFYILGDYNNTASAIFCKLNQNYDTIWTLKNIDMADYWGDWVKIDSTRFLLGTSKTKMQSNDDAYDIVLRTVDTSGAILNTVTIGAGSGDNRIYTILKTEDKGFLILGTDGNALTPPYEQYALYKIDSSGNVQWEKKYGGNNNDIPADLIRCRDGSYVFLGTSIFLLHNSKIQIHPYVAKVKADGTLIKKDSIVVKKVSLREEVYYRSNLIESMDGGYVFPGWLDSDGTNSKYYAFLIKLDAGLNVEWKYIDSTNGNTINRAQKVVQLKDSSYMVIGNTQNVGLIYKISKNGILLNKKTFTSAICGNLAIGNFLNLNIQPDSTFLVCGVGTNAGLHGYLAKFDSLWSVPYDPALRYCDIPPTASFTCLQDTNTNAVKFINNSNPGVPYGIIEVSKWKFEDSTISNQISPLINQSGLIDSAWARVIVTNNLGCKDTIAQKVKVTHAVITETEYPQSKKFNLYVYPNPASEYINFKIAGANKKYSLSLYNCLGQQEGSYEFAKEYKLSVANISKGMYFYKITDEEGNSENGKFVVE